MRHIVQFTISLKVNNCNSKTYYNRLFEWIYSANNFILIDLWSVFEANSIVSLLTVFISERKPGCLFPTNKFLPAFK